MTSSTIPSFAQWLESNGYDAKEWSPELRASLRARFEQETAPPVQAAAEPSAVAIVAPVDCQWPARVYRVGVML